MSNRVTAEQEAHARKVLVDNYNLKAGSRVFTLTRHISRTGETKYVDVFLIKDNDLHRITMFVARVTGATYDDKHEAIRTQDIGNLIDNLGYTLFSNHNTNPNYHLTYERI